MLLLAFGINGNGRDVVFTHLGRCEGAYVRRCGGSAYQHVVGIEPHLADGAVPCSGPGRNRDIVAYTIRTCRNFQQTRAVGFLVAVEGDILDVEAALFYEQGEHMAASFQFSHDVAVQRFPLTIATRTGNLHKFAEIRQTVETVFCQVEPAAR